MIRRLRNTSVATKLYLLVGLMGFLIAIELLTLRFSMNTLSSVRAFVGGNGRWSRAEKASVITLLNYAQSRKEEDFEKFYSEMQIPIGDRQARNEMLKPNFERARIVDGLKKGDIHEDDIPGVIELVQRFYWEPHIGGALRVWAEADVLVEKLTVEAERLHTLVKTNAPRKQVNQQLDVINSINNQVTAVESKFQEVLGEGSRYLERVVITILFLLVLSVEATGLTFTMLFARKLTKTLNSLIQIARSVARGDFKVRASVDSKDELGQLAHEINAMTAQLEANIGSRKQAEEDSQTKSAFLANMSHEIRTPLGAILGFAEILKDQSLSQDERDRYLDTIQRNGKSLTKLINDILDLSKVEAGSVTVELLDFSLPAMLQDVVELFAANAADKNISLRLILDASARMRVKSDPTRLKQILFNIVGNAIKFTNSGSVCVMASVAGGVITIRVQDSGLGITENQRLILFAPFTQADSSTSRRFGGTGLGLALSRKLAEALGGTVFIDSSHSGPGSTFVIEVEERSPTASSAPLRAKPTPSATTSQAAPSLEAQATASLEGLRILIADDSPDNRELLRVFLKRRKVELSFAINGREAVEAALKNEFDLVLMDIQMPEMDGYAALSELLKHGYKKPVIAFTAHAMKEEEERTERAGFRAHLTKPVNEAQLIETICSVL